ncbi:MAG: 50S ribosomal protein L7/L12 [Erysipelotrichaceae bacterium]|jgi:large subunit ribosomal protein L7/L12|nr:50S ribosomal protein L7/L12 [Solobacterium sp.]MCR5448723.1 50S ribosomal protein L7/L12 [Solobacterium sp.]MDO4191713.1 50S ribosomal protein L7/L12 [Erysipelotrichaceae bacterium]MDO5121005.1 50S ribosomal protein L7/L12 [Erysipelotrichaceae bacterium]
MAKLTQEEILAYLDEATILELNELVKAIEEKYGVSAAAPVAVAAPAEAAEPAAPTNVTVVMTSFGDSKVGVIKVVRTITGLGLVDAKKLVDGIPAEIKKDVPMEEAENIKKQLVEAGATVEFK